MSAHYKPIGWTRVKLVYDALLLAGIVLYLLAYLELGPLLSAHAAAVDRPILRMRAFGSCAFILLTVILMIGPLARLDKRFLPLLYNRRHFGVLTAVIALTHAGFVLDWYFAFSPTPKSLALLSANTSFGVIEGFPFELFGIFALLILTVLAVTSHDFWLNFLSPSLWKAIHMSVYAAYAAIVLHVALGALQEGGNPLMAALVLSGATLVTTLHLIAGRGERAQDKASSALDAKSGWIIAGDLAETVEGKALLTAAPQGERIAVFRSKGRLFALSNVCSHQNGPIGEGKIVAGFVTCPWHGYQYRLEDGCSPPPFKERLRTYRVTLNGSRILVDPIPLPLGAKAEPALIPPPPEAVLEGAS